MGSKYDIAVFRNVRYNSLVWQASEDVDFGMRVDGPWQGSSQVTAAQIGGNVVIVSPAMGTPRGIDTALAQKLGCEALFATVWDSVSTYSLSARGPGVNRYLSAEPDLDAELEGDAELDFDDEPAGEVITEQSGTPLPEEPLGTPLDEAYIQITLRERCGIDPGQLTRLDAKWFEVVPHPRERPKRSAPTKKRGFWQRLFSPNE